MSFSGGIELASLITKIKVDIKGFSKDMDGVKAEGVAKAREVSKEMEKVAKVGSTMSKVGKEATKFITLPLIGAAAAAGKLGMDLSENMGMVSTLLDGTVDQVQQRTSELKDSVLKISNDTGKASSDIADGAYQVVSAFGDTADAAKILETAAKGAKASGASTTDTINLLSAVTKGYGDTSAKANEKASDLAFMTAKLGQTTFPELAGSIGSVVPLANALNVSQEELFGTMATATGVTGNASEVSTQFRGILQSLMAPTADMTALMKEMGYENGETMVKNLGLQQTIDTITKAAKDSGKPLQSYIGSIEGQTLALALSGAQSDVYKEKLAAMNDVVGSTDEAFAKVNDTTGAKFGIAINKAKNAAIKLGDSLGPLIEKGAELIGDFADKISNLSPEAVESIVKIGGMIAVMGPLLKITGGMVSGYAKLKPLLSGANTAIGKGIPLLGKLGIKMAESSGTIGKIGAALSKLAPVASSAVPALAGVAKGAGLAGTAAATAGGTAGLGALATSLGGAALAAAPVVLGVGAVAAAGYGLYKVLNEDTIPAVDLFADGTVTSFDTVTGAVTTATVKISEETQKQFQSYINLSDSAQQETMNMYLGVAKVTDENVNIITEKVDTMVEQIITATNKQRDSVISDYTMVMDGVGGITEQQKKDVLTQVNEECNNRIIKVQETKDRLIEIYGEIKANGGSITQSQQEELDGLYITMKENAIASLSKSKAEQETILHNLSLSSGGITAEMAGNSIREMNRIKDDSILAAQTEHDKVVAIAMQMKDSKDKVTREAAEAVIKNADEELVATTEAANKIKEDGIDKLMESYDELRENVDTNTGEVLNYGEKIVKWWSELLFPTKRAEIDVIYNDSGRADVQAEGSNRPNHRYNGLDYVPFDGYNAWLHEGERVLTKKENEQLTKGSLFTSGTGGKIEISVPLYINQREFAYATKEIFAEEMGF